MSELPTFRAPRNSPAWWWLRCQTSLKSSEDRRVKRNVRWYLEVLVVSLLIVAAFIVIVWTVTQIIEGGPFDHTS